MAALHLVQHGHRPPQRLRQPRPLLRLLLSLPDDLRQRVLVLELHQLQTTQRLLRHIAAEKAHLEQLQGQLVVLHGLIRCLVLCRHLQIELRHAVAAHQQCPGPQAAVVEAGELHAFLPQQPELPGHIVKLPHQLDAQRQHLGERLVPIVDHVS